jgi:hypothetical protein
MFFALIILVIISISMVALVKMTDINAIIAGNLAFRNPPPAAVTAGLKSPSAGCAHQITVPAEWTRGRAQPIR